MLFTRNIKTEKDDVQEDNDNVQTLPEFIIPPSPVYVAKGDNAVLKCQVTGQPSPSVIWSKNSETIKHGSKYKVRLTCVFGLMGHNFSKFYKCLNMSNPVFGGLQITQAQTSLRIRAV